MCEGWRHSVAVGAPAGPTATPEGDATGFGSEEGVLVLRVRNRGSGPRENIFKQKGGGCRVVRGTSAGADPYPSLRTWGFLPARITKYRKV